MTTQTLFTAHDVLAVLREVVAAKPAGHKNPGLIDTDGGGGGCRYVESDGRPSCIAGTVLYEMDRSVLPDYDDGFNFEAVIELDLSQFTEVAGRLLLEAQNCADSGDTWAEALSEAQFRVLGE